MPNTDLEQLWRRIVFSIAIKIRMTICAITVFYLRILSKTKAQDIIMQIKKAVSRWPTLADKYQIPRQEQEQMSLAFELAMG